MRPDRDTWVDNFQRRAIQDALNEASGRYWRRREAAFANVGTPACDETARACRNAAAFWDYLRTGKLP